MNVSGCQLDTLDRVFWLLLLFNHIFCISVMSCAIFVEILTFGIPKKPWFISASTLFYLAGWKVAN